MRNQLSCWLSEDEIERIHNDSLEILWERGMKVQHPKALEILEDAGAKIDRDMSVVHYPPELIERCLELVPGNFILAGRNPDDNPE